MDDVMSTIPPPSSLDNHYHSPSHVPSQQQPVFPFWCGNFILHDYTCLSNSCSTRFVDWCCSRRRYDHHELIANGNDTPTVVPNEIDDINNNSSNNIDNTTSINGNVSDTIDSKTTMTIHGLAIDVYGRATIGMSSIFLGPALLSLANVAAGCYSNNDADDNGSSGNNNINDSCDSVTIYGFRPSSLLTNVAAVSGLLGCIVLPFFGSLIDHTNYRQFIGYTTGIVICCIKIVEFIGLTLRHILPNIWLYIAILQVASSITFYLHLLAAYAYISELSSIPQKQSYYNSSFFVIMYMSTLIFMIYVLFLSNTIQIPSSTIDMASTDVSTALIALGITIITCVSCFYYSWKYCFPYVNAKKLVPPNQTLYSAGFYTIYHTIQQLLYNNNYNVDDDDDIDIDNGHVHDGSSAHNLNATNELSIPIAAASSLKTVHDKDDTNNCTMIIDHSTEMIRSGFLRRHVNGNNINNNINKNKAIFYLLCSVSFSEAAANAIIVISTTYMKEILQMNADDIGIVFFIVLLSGIPGSQIGRYVTVSLCNNNPTRSLICCNVLFGTSTIIAAMFLCGPKDSFLCFIFGGCWGTLLGWLQPQNTSAYVPILPKNKEAEMMGLYLFACQIFSWLPPTVFTIMNESHLPMSYGLGSLCIYFITSVLCLYMVGDYHTVASSVTTDTSTTIRQRNHEVDHQHPSYASTNDNEEVVTCTSYEMTTQPSYSGTLIKEQQRHQESNVYYPISPQSASIQQRHNININNDHLVT